MAQYIQQPLVGSALQRLFRLQGRVRPALEEFIIPVVKVGDVSQESAPGITRHAFARFSQAAVVGQRAVWRIETPPGTLLQITRMYVRPGAAASVFGYFGSSIAAPGSTAIKTYTDGRILKQGQRPAGVLTYGTQVGNLGTIQYGQVANPIPDEMDIHPTGWIIGSNSTTDYGFAEFNLGVDNTLCDVLMEWDEYPVF